MTLQPRLKALHFSGATQRWRGGLRRGHLLRVLPSAFALSGSLVELLRMFVRRPPSCAKGEKILRAIGYLFGHTGDLGLCAGASEHGGAAPRPPCVAAGFVGDSQLRRQRRTSRGRIAHCRDAAC